MRTENRAWQLEDFVDSLVVELDKTRETLAVKAINKPLTYTVKEMALDLNIFPTYDGDAVQFKTAQPGEQGASKVTIQLGSITDQQVRATTTAPDKKNDVTIDQIDIDPKAKKELRKLGVKSADDLKRLEEKDVDIEKVADNTIDYNAIANQIQKSRRAQLPPSISSLSLSEIGDAADGPVLLVHGENLRVHERYEPVAVFNQKLARIRDANPSQVQIQLSADHPIGEMNELILTVDPYTIVKVMVRTKNDNADPGLKRPV